MGVGSMDADAERLRHGAFSLFKQLITVPA